MLRRYKTTFQTAAFVAASALTACHSGAAIPQDSNAALPATGMRAQTREHGGGMTPIGSGFYLPRTVAVAPNCSTRCDVYVVDNTTTVKKISPPFTGSTHGTISTVGSGFENPMAIAVDAKGNVYVCDETRQAIFRVTPRGKIEEIGAGFHTPWAVTLDPEGNVYVVTDNVVEKVAPPFTGPTRGTISTIASGLSDPQAVALDASCASHCPFYVAEPDNNLVLRFPGDGKHGHPIGSGLNKPFGIAVDAHENVYVADYGARAVDRIAPDGTISTIGNGFISPEGVAVDAGGNAYVADAIYGVWKIAPLSPLGALY